MNEIKELLLTAARESAIKAVNAVSLSKSFDEAKKSGERMLREIARLENIETVFYTAKQWKRPVMLRFWEGIRPRYDPLSLGNLRVARESPAGKLCVDEYSGHIITASLEGLDLGSEE